MAFGTPYNLGVIGTKQSTTEVITTVASVPAGDTIIVVAYSDAVYIPSTNPTCTDSAGNTYTYFAGSSGPGNLGTLLVFAAFGSAGLASGGTITVSALSTSLYYASALGVSGVLSQHYLNTFQGTGSSTTPTVSATGLSSGSTYLALGLVCTNGPTGDSFTQATNWAAPPNAIGSSGGNAGTNYSLRAGYRNFTGLTSVAYAPTLGTSRSWSDTVVVFKQGTDYSVSGSETASATDSLTGDHVKNATGSETVTSVEASTTIASSPYVFETEHVSSVVVSTLPQTANYSRDSSNFDLINPRSYLFTFIAGKSGSMGVVGLPLFRTSSSPTGQASVELWQLNSNSVTGTPSVLLGTLSVSFFAIPTTATQAADAQFDFSSQAWANITAGVGYGIVVNPGASWTSTAACWQMTSFYGQGGLPAPNSNSALQLTRWGYKTNTTDAWRIDGFTWYPFFVSLANTTLDSGVGGLALDSARSESITAADSETQSKVTYNQRPEASPGLVVSTLPYFANETNGAAVSRTIFAGNRVGATFVAGASGNLGVVRFGASRVYSGMPIPSALGTAELWSADPSTRIPQTLLASVSFKFLESLANNPFGSAPTVEIDFSAELAASITSGSTYAVVLVAGSDWGVTGSTYGIGARDFSTLANSVAYAPDVLEIFKIGSSSWDTSSSYRSIFEAQLAINADTATGGLAQQSIASETGAATEAGAVVKSTPGALNETLASAETALGILDIIAARDESASSQDSQLAGIPRDSASAESVTAQDQNAQTLAQPVAVTEAAAATDSPENYGIYAPVDLGSVSVKNAAQSITTVASAPAGQLIWVSLISNSTTLTPTVSDSAGNTYVAYGGAAVITDATGTKSWLFYSLNTNGLASGSTISFSTNVAYYGGTAWTTKGIAALPPTFTGSGTGTSTTPAATVTGLNAADTYTAFGFVEYNGPTGDTFTQATNWTTPPNTYGSAGSGATTNYTMRAGYRTFTGLSSVSYAPTLGTSRTWNEYVLVIRQGATYNSALSESVSSSEASVGVRNVTYSGVAAEATSVNDSATSDYLKNADESETVTAAESFATTASKKSVLAEDPSDLAASTIPLLANLSLNTYGDWLSATVAMGSTFVAPKSGRLGLIRYPAIYRSGTSPTTTGEITLWQLSSNNVDAQPQTLLGAMSISCVPLNGTPAIVGDLSDQAWASVTAGVGYAIVIRGGSDWYPSLEANAGWFGRSGYNTPIGADTQTTSAGVFTASYPNNLNVYDRGGLTPYIAYSYSTTNKDSSIGGLAVDSESSESTTSQESQVVALLASRDLTDSLALSDSPTGLRALQSTASEAGTATEVSTNTTAASVALNESSLLSDNAVNILAATATGNESVSTQDSQVNSIPASRDQTDTLTVSDSASPTNSLGLAVNESSAAADTSDTANSALAKAITESLSPADASANAMLINSDHTAMAAAVDSSVGTAQQLTTQLESITAQESNTQTLTAVAALTESSLSVDSAESVNISGPVDLGTSNVKAAAASITTIAAAPAERVIWVSVIANSTTITPTVTDSAGNTYTPLSSTVISPTTGWLFYSMNSNGLPAGGTISFSADVTYYGASAWSLQGFSTPFFNGTGSGASTTPSTTVTGLSATETYTAFGFVEYNGPTGDTFTQATNWSTPPTAYGSVGGNAGTNYTMRTGYRTFTGLTSISYAPTLGTSRTWSEHVIVIRQPVAYSGASTEPVTAVESLTAVKAVPISEPVNPTDSPENYLVAGALAAESISSADAAVTLVDSVAARTEPASASDTVAASIVGSTFVYDVTAAEAASADDTSSVSAVLIRSLLESSAASEALSALLSAATIATESASANDNQTAQQAAAAAAFFEAVGSSDAVVGALLAETARTEAVSAFDAATSISATVAALTEPATAAETSAGALVLNAAENEQVSAAAAQTSTQTIVASASETAIAAESSIQNVALPLAVSESAIAADTGSSNAVINNLVSEPGTVADTQASQQIALANRTETATASDAQATNQTLLALGQESLVAAENSATNATTVSGVLEAIAIGDSESVKTTAINNTAENVAADDSQSAQQAAIAVRNENENVAATEASDKTVTGFSVVEESATADTAQTSTAVTTVAVTESALGTDTQSDTLQVLELVAEVVNAGGTETTALAASLSALEATFASDYHTLSVTFESAQDEVNNPGDAGISAQTLATDAEETAVTEDAGNSSLGAADETMEDIEPVQSSEALQDTLVAIAEAADAEAVNDGKRLYENFRIENFEAAGATTNTLDAFAAQDENLAAYDGSILRIFHPAIGASDQIYTVSREDRVFRVAPELRAHRVNNESRVIRVRI